MDAYERPLDFHFAGGPAGLFETAEYPRSPGAYRYMPYRSPWHAEMHEERRRGNPPRCYYESGGRRVSFTVVDAPEYGVLVLDGFVTEPG